jgi:hypothetical protein
VTSRLTDRRLLVEQRLFACLAQLERAREELGVAEERYREAAIALGEACNRRAAAETPLADGEWCRARRREERRRQFVSALRHDVDELEGVRDELLARLVG